MGVHSCQGVKSGAKCLWSHGGAQSPGAVGYKPGPDCSHHGLRDANTLSPERRQGFLDGLI